MHQGGEMGPAMAGAVFGLVVGWVAGRSALRATGARTTYRAAKDLMPGLRKGALTATFKAARNFAVIGVLVAAVLTAWLGPR
jgi:hypothetical protein